MVSVIMVAKVKSFQKTINKKENFKGKIFQNRKSEKSFNFLFLFLNMMKTILFVSDPTEKLTLFTKIVIDSYDKFAPEIKSNLKEKFTKARKSANKSRKEVKSTN